MVFGFVLGALVLVSPLRRVWIADWSPWWAAYLVWLVVIVGGGVVAHRWGTDGRR